MFKNIFLICLAVLSLSSVAFAGDKFAAASTPNISSTKAPLTSDTALYFGIMGGYGDTNWKSLERNHWKYQDDTGWAAGAYFGYDFDRNMAAQVEYVYFGNRAKVTNDLSSDELNIVTKTQAVDLVGKLKVSAADNLILFVKAGVGYLMSDHRPSSALKAFNPVCYSDKNLGVFNLVYGLGLDYFFTPNFVGGLSWTRFNGEPKHDDSGDHIRATYQPYADFYSVNLTYKFNL